MKRILITGMSGTGKSTVITELAARGHQSVDLDSEIWSQWVPADGNPTGANPGHDWLWNEDKLMALLDLNSSQTLFASGCASNMGRFIKRFDLVILLSVQLDVMLDRIRVRTNNRYGKEDEEIVQVKENHRQFEPQLRLVTNHEIDTSIPIEQVIEKILQVSNLLNVKEIT